MYSSFERDINIFKDDDGKLIMKMEVFMINIKHDNLNLVQKEKLALIIERTASNINSLWSKPTR